MDGLLYIWYSEEGIEGGRSRLDPSSLYQMHPSTAIVPITVLLYNGPLLWRVLMCP